MDRMKRKGLPHTSGTNRRLAAVLVALALAISASVGIQATRVRPAEAAAATQSLAVNPSRGFVGAKLTLTTSGFPVGLGCTITYMWAYPGGPTVTFGSGPPNVPFVTSFPNAPASTYPVSASCTIVTGALVAAGSRVTVTGPAPTTVPPTTVPPTTATTTAPTTTTTRAGATTTTQVGQTTTTAVGDTTTSTPDSTDTTAVTPDTAPGSTSSRPGSQLRLDALAIAPGGSVNAIGEGCDPDAPVAIHIDAQEVGRTAATDDGSFRTELAVASLDVNRYQVVAECGPTLTAPLDVVLASQVDDGSTTTVGIIVFFVLMALLIFRQQLFPPKPKPVTSEPAETEEEFLA
jgi:hypothetical protein